MQRVMVSVGDELHFVDLPDRNQIHTLVLTFYPESNSGLTKLQLDGHSVDSASGKVLLDDPSPELIEAAAFLASAWKKFAGEPMENKEHSPEDSTSVRTIPLLTEEELKAEEEAMAKCTCPAPGCSVHGT